MAGKENDLITLLSSQAFTKIFNNNLLAIAELDAVIALLIRLRIAFDLEYSPGTQRLAESAQLTIYINPTTTLGFTINLEPGSSLFSSVFPT